MPMLLIWGKGGGGHIEQLGVQGSRFSSTLQALFFYFSSWTTKADIFASVTYLQGRNAFASAGREASIGRLAFGLQWAAFVCLLLATVLSCMAKSKKRNNKHNWSHDQEEGRRSRGRFGGRFGRKRWAVPSWRLLWEASLCQARRSIWSIVEVFSWFKWRSPAS